MSAEKRKSAESIASETSATAKNAVKHGFCATKYVAVEIALLAEAIRLDLIETHVPVSKEELDAIAELALNKARLFELEKAFHARQKVDRERARENDDRQDRRRFLSDLADWKANPSVYFDLLGDTLLGAAYFERLWSIIADSFRDDGPGPAAQQVRQAVMISGSRWEVSEITADGAWVMARFMKSSLEPTVELDKWIADSAGASDRKRAEWHVARAPERAVSRSELKAKAEEERRRWSLRSKELRSHYETGDDRSADAFVGILPGDKEQAEEFRLILRYLTAARNRVDRLERRLDSLKKGRAIAAYRADRDAHRETRRHEREARDATNAYQEEQARIDRERQAYYRVPESPEFDDDMIDEAEPIARFEEVFHALNETAKDDATTLTHESQVTDNETVTSPLRNRIDALAARCGVVFEDADDWDRTDAFDDEIRLSPEEQEEFEMWKKRMERMRFDDSGRATE